MKPNLPKSSTSPFPGRRPYAEHEANVFFGRDAESDLVVQGLAKSRLTLLSGPPGVGKTSLLRAGVMPHLRGMASQFGQTPIIIFWDNWQQGAQADPLNDLIDEIQRCCVETLAGFAPVRVPRVRAFEHVIEYWAAKAPLFIIFDRFEDYLLSHGDEDGEGKFSVEFPRVVKRADLQANFLLAMRGGAHAKLGRLAQRLPQLFERSLRLKPLGADAARAAIVLPIQAYNREHPELVPVHVDSTLVEYVIRTVKIDAVGAAAGDAGDEITRVDASSLQTTMQELWDAQIGSGTLAEHAPGEPHMLGAPALAAHVEAEPPVASIGMTPDAMPEFGAMTDMMPHIGAMPDAPPAEMPDTAPPRWRFARNGRALAALAYLSICTFAVVGAAGWIAQTTEENDKQEALSVQEKADQALARARETLAKAAQWQAANEQPSRAKAPEIADGVGNERVVPELPPDAVKPVERLVDAPTEKRSVREDSEAAQRKPEVAVTAAERGDKTNDKPNRTEQPRPSPAVTPDATPAPALTPAVAAIPKIAAPGPTPVVPPPNPAATPAPADQAAATASSAAVRSATSEAVSPASEEPLAVANSGGSPADEIPAWAKEPAIEAAPASSALVEPINSAPASPAVTAPIPSAPVKVAPTERRSTTVAVKQEKSATKTIVQARAKDNPPRPGARAQSFQSNNVIDAVRAQSAPSVPRRDSGELFAAQNGKKAPLRTASYDKNAGRDTRDDAPSIFIHVRDQSQLAQTMRLKRRLEANGIVVSGIKTVTRGPDDADLRYFRRNERGEARQMVDLLQSFNVPIESPKYISGFESTATSRQYELWFPAVN